MSAELLKLLLYFAPLFLALFIGLGVYLNNRERSINSIFVLYIFSLSLWIVTNFLSDTSSNVEIALLWAKASLIGPLFVGPTIYHFAHIFPKGKLTKKRRLMIWLPMFIFFPFIFTPLNIESAVVQDWGLEFQPGILYLPFVAFLGVYVIRSTLLFRQKMKVVTASQREQIKFIILGMTITLLVGMTVSVILPSFGFSRLAILAPASTLFIFGSIAIAIVRHKFLDISVLVYRTVALMLVFVFVIGLYLILTLTFANSFGPQHRDTVTLILTFVLVISYPSIKSFIEKITRNIFFHETYNIASILEELGSIIQTSLSVSTISNEVIKTLHQRLHIKSGGVLILSNHKQMALYPNEISTFTTEITNHIGTFGAIEKTLFFDDLEEGKKKNLMRDLAVSCVAPLEVRGKITGYLVLQEKLGGDSYTKQDRRLINLLVPQLSIAVNNALAYEEIKSFNITLKEEVERATAKLKAANERLRELDQVKDEFVSITSHELRTPLTSIRNYQWMLLNQKGGKLSEKQRYYIERAYQATNRLTKLVTDMLNVSRIDSGRILLDVRKVDLPELTTDIIEDLQVKIKQRAITINHQIPKAKTIPSVLADEDKVKEVIINLIYNALKFTPKKGMVTISYELHKEQVQLSVSDTGIGISADYIDTLFTKFGFVKDSLKANHPTTDSTGLGLYISKSIIELHGGKIWAESEGQGKGATFRFTLPTYDEKKYKKLHKRYNKEKDAGLLHNTIG